MLTHMQLAPTPAAGGCWGVSTLFCAFARRRDSVAPEVHLQAEHILSALHVCPALMPAHGIMAQLHHMTEASAAPDSPAAAAACRSCLPLQSPCPSAHWSHSSCPPRLSYVRGRQKLCSARWASLAPPMLLLHCRHLCQWLPVVRSSYACMLFA